MALSDLLSDVLTRIRNAQRVGHNDVDVPASKMVRAVLSVLQQEGYIEGFQEAEALKGAGKYFKVALKYYKGQPVISVIQRISKPGRRVYKGTKALPKSYGGLGVVIVSTSHGVMSDEEARHKQLGGELLCNVY